MVDWDRYLYPNKYRSYAYQDGVVDTTGLALIPPYVQQEVVMHPVDYRGVDSPEPPALVIEDDVDTVADWYYGTIITKDNYSSKTAADVPGSQSGDFYYNTTEKATYRIP